MQLMIEGKKGGKVLYISGKNSWLDLSVTMNQWQYTTKTDD